MQPLLHMYADYFELYRCLGHGLKMYIFFCLDIILRICFVTFLQVELSHFSDIITFKVNRYWVPCVRNSSYILC